MVKYFNYTLKFALEIGMLVTYGYWGFSQAKNPWIKYGLAIALVVAAIALWAYFGAPRSDHRLPLPYRLLFETVMFGTAALMLYHVKQLNLAWVFAGLAVLCIVLEWVFKQ